MKISHHPPKSLVKRKPAPTAVEAILRQAYRLHRWDRLSRHALRTAGS